MAENANLKDILGKDLEITEKRNLIAVKSNTLIRNQSYTLERGAGESLSLLEQKILLYIIAQIKPTDTELKEQIFDIKEFCAICGISTGGRNYELLKKTLAKLQSRVMWLKTKDKEVSVQWIRRVIIEKNDGKVKIKLDDIMIPFLLQLQQNYTQIPIFNIVRMKSKYGIALFEYLQSYLFLEKDITVSIQELKEILDCTQYKLVGDIKRYVIEPALKDINTYTSIKCEYELLKTGRAYTHIIFYLKNLKKHNVKEKIERETNILAEVDRPGYEINKRVKEQIEKEKQQQQPKEEKEIPISAPTAPKSEPEPEIKQEPEQGTAPEPERKTTPEPEPQAKNIIKKFLKKFLKI